MTFEEKNVLNINNGILALFHFYNGIEANPINFKEDLECIFSLYKNDYRYRNDENKYFLIEVSERMLDFEYLINKDKVWRLEGTDDEPEGMQEFVQVYCDAYNASLEVHWYFEELYPNEFIGYDEIPIPIMSIDYNLQQKDPEKPKPELKIDQIALKYAYEGLQITRENGNGIAKKYGHNSGEKLFQRFTYFSSSANRKGKPNLCTPKKLDNKIKLIESIIELLPTDKQERAKDEVSILKKIYEAEYQ
jgi:hypothetical protein